MKRGDFPLAFLGQLSSRHYCDLQSFVAEGLAEGHWSHRISQIERDLVEALAQLHERVDCSPDSSRL